MRVPYGDGRHSRKSSFCDEISSEWSAPPKFTWPVTSACHVGQCLGVLFREVIVDAVPVLTVFETLTVAPGHTLVPRREVSLLHKVLESKEGSLTAGDCVP